MWVSIKYMICLTETGEEFAHAQNQTLLDLILFEYELYRRNILKSKH